MTSNGRRRRSMSLTAVARESALRALARIRAEDKDAFASTRRALAALAEQPHPGEAVAWEAAGSTACTCPASGSCTRWTRTRRPSTSSTSPPRCDDQHDLTSACGDLTSPAPVRDLCLYPAKLADCYSEGRRGGDRHEGTKPDLLDAGRGGA